LDCGAFTAAFPLVVHPKMNSRQDGLKFHERRDDRRVRYPASMVKSPADKLKQKT
jgi:hypothetical protein